MPHTTILFVHLQYDAPNSPQSRALRALAATVARPAAPPLYLVGGYAYDDFDTDSLPLAVAQAVRDAHQARTDTAMAGQLQAHVAALAAEQITVTPLLRAGAPQTVLAQVASALDAALVLVGTPQVHQGFAIALGGSSEALQAALPCPVYRVIPPAAGDPRGWDLIRGSFFDGETSKKRPSQVFTSPPLGGGVRDRVCWGAHGVDSLP
jgi:nucleotide-binding universal stress UspA family protein